MKQGTAKFLLFFQLERGGPSFAVLNVKKKKKERKVRNNRQEGASYGWNYCLARYLSSGGSGGWNREKSRVMIVDRQKKATPRWQESEIAVSGLLRRKERNKLRGGNTNIKREREREAGKRVLRKDSFSQAGRNADSSRVEATANSCLILLCWRSSLLLLLLLRSIRYRFANPPPLKTFLSAKISV